MRTNLTQCGIHYMANPELSWIYGYNGTTKGIRPNFASQVTFKGCETLCGAGIDWYQWTTASATITTWILPVVGMMLQAPFESNAFKRTLLATIRWVGSPMASLAYILWNIKVSGKCALMVDMAVRYEDQIPGEKSDFASIRDSFYILMTMNQYTMNARASMRKESEGLLRIVLFSKDLRLLGTDSPLNATREKLAQELRKGRKRGVVPVFISTMWFLFALAISIQSAFGYLGENTTAHDLALGFLLSWLPVLILGSIVDRNPVAADDMRRKLNELVDLVRRSLQDDTIRQEFINSFKNQPEAERMKEWVENVHRRCGFMTNFFVGFAGQGRIPWHYGAAHPILSDIEGCYIARRGRNWLDNEEEARTNLVMGPVDEGGLLWFDLRELWQILSSVLIVTFTIAGAFILSFFTPTVGLGCRSGGYLIFTCLTFGLLVLELIVWWVSSPIRVEQPQWLVRRRTNLESNASFARFEQSSRAVFRRVSETALSLRDSLESWSICLLKNLLSLFPMKNKTQNLDQFENTMNTRFSNIHDYSLKEWTRRFFFIPVELFNTTWLIYIVLAQTFGFYHNCSCSCSIWGGGGGYLDFTQADVTNSPWVRYYWTGGTVLASGTMGIGMIYVVIEWCLQSHLSTENYASAQRGLRRTRRYRYITYPIRFLLRWIISKTLALFALICKLFSKSYTPNQSLLWTKETTYYFRPPHSSTTLPRQSYIPSPPSPRPSTDATSLLSGVQLDLRTTSTSRELQPYPYTFDSADLGIGPWTPPTHTRILHISPQLDRSLSPASPPRSHPRTLHGRDRGDSESSKMPLIRTPRGRDRGDSVSSQTRLLQTPDLDSHKRNPSPTPSQFSIPRKPSSQDLQPQRTYAGDPQSPASQFSIPRKAPNQHLTRDSGQGFGLGISTTSILSQPRSNSHSPAPSRLSMDSIDSPIHERRRLQFPTQQSTYPQQGIDEASGSRDNRAKGI
ncbi:hypothetical protein K432DRAFT_407131 [Lepidopterella palustris CBS 459.81]|uniref:Uncharacterized protein n=1 Tax=Lepidopterella palustris CBS 459.81 TaxID=1314670 RepID=A0A8E2JD44_9PEZI|nr:hypothetical protein K432DRAFT_407131 [Lepidopterella palustris CBS 459.81]